MATPSGTRIFMDPVHGTIALEEYLVKIIDTPEFQRLRKIKQTGGVCYVFPGATHTRFEHSLGVCHIAGHLIKELQERCQPEYKITKNEEICIKIAALCHDLGHGPFSHFFDYAIDDNQSQKGKEKHSHEYRSGEIVEKVINRLSSETAAQEDPDLLIANQHIALIKAMIVFSNEYKSFKEICENEKENFKAENDSSPERKAQLKRNIENRWKKISAGQPTTKSYLFEIVANGFTGIDVDKMDYFARDSRSVGLPNSFDWRRYIQTASIRKVIDEADGTEFCHICSRDKDVTSLYELFHTRYILHRTVYQHKTVVNIQHMIKDALIAANKAILINGKCLLECYDDLEAFIQLTDSIEDIIIKEAECCSLSQPLEQQQSSPPEQHEQASQPKWKVDLAHRDDLLKAKKLFDNIRKRNLPKYLGMSESSEKNLIIEKIESDCKDFVIDKPAKFDYGKKGANPMDSHYFYRKEDSDTTDTAPFLLKEDEVSVLLLPKSFMETKIFWYFDITQEGAPHKKLTYLQALFKKDGSSS